MLSSRQSSIYCPIGENSKLLQKKIPQNPRYKNIKPAVDSGVSVRTYLEALRESQKNINYKRDECFKRIKLSTFVKLIIQVNQEFQTEIYGKVIQENSHSESHEQESVITLVKANSEEPISSMQSVYSSVLMGVGELDLKNAQKKLLTPSLPKISNILPYLLLDVRDKDDFMQCCIISAKSYPYPMLSRAYNYETKDMLLYKNSPDKLIVIYDEDESIASRVASTLVQRGYDNIYMLSGGLKLAVEKFPSGLVNGNLPSSILKNRKLPKLNVSDRGDLPQLSQKPRNDLQENFSADDIESLQQFLDKYTASTSAMRWIYLCNSSHSCTNGMQYRKKCDKLCCCKFDAISRASSRMSRIGSSVYDTASCGRSVTTSAPSSFKRKPPWK